MGVGLVDAADGYSLKTPSATICRGAGLLRLKHNAKGQFSYRHDYLSRTKNSVKFATPG